MKKSFFLCAACIIAGASVKSQNNKVEQKPTVTQMEQVEIPPAPPAPPALYSERVLPVPPAPPAPPVAPEPPAPPAPPTQPERKSNYQTRTINSAGYDISVHRIRNSEIIFVKRNSVVQKIRMETWKANRKMYEKKYGRLPFPPPSRNAA